jgi:hypothetical protein
MGSFVGWAIMAAIVLIIVWRWNQRRRASLDAVVEPLTLPHMEGDGSFDFDIVGEASYQDALDIIAGGKTKDGHEIECVASLMREPHNSHDPNAVAVLIEGRKVGYMPREAAAGMAKLMDQHGYTQVTADAMIVGGWSDGKGEGHYGVKLDLVS